MSVPAARRPVVAVGVLLPAHNEERRVRAAVDGLRAAASRCPVPVHLAVVLDHCTDQTSARLEGLDRPGAFATTQVLTVAARNVGAARRLGADALLRVLPGDRTWLASTDADSVVPPHWLTRQLEYGDSGSDLVAGTVRIDTWRFHTPAQRQTYQVGYDSSRPHQHVHGANLGIDASTYVGVGGFPAIRTGEDIALVEAAVAAGCRVEWADDIAVTTSSRVVGRAPHGLAGHLSQL